MECSIRVILIKSLERSANSAGEWGWGDRTTVREKRGPSLFCLYCGNPWWSKQPGGFLAHKHYKPQSRAALTGTPALPGLLMGPPAQLCKHLQNSPLQRTAEAKACCEDGGSSPQTLG